MFRHFSFRRNSALRNLASFAFGLSVICAASTNRLSADVDWYDDAELAVATAKKEDKDLLLLFTGSDWCQPCMKLKQEVFEKEVFGVEASEDFVFVIFDFPKKKTLDDRTVKQNKAWAKKYGIGAYPTVVLADQNQRPYAITGYRPGGVENYLAILGEFHQQRIRRDEALAKANTLTGEERAKMLDKAISEMDPDLAQLYYEDIVGEIVSIDKEDNSGLRTKWNASKDSELRKIIMTDIVVVSRLEKPDVAVQFIDKVLSEMQFPASQRLQIFQSKLNLLRELGDIEAMDRQLDLMINMEELTNESKQRLIVKKVFLLAGTNRKDQAQKYLDQSLKTAGFHAAILWLAKGQLLVTEKDYEGAITCFDTGIAKANGDPELLVELYGAKADCWMAQNDQLKAIQTLDEFAENQSMPADLRSEALLHKAMIMRDSGRSRRAKLVENRAVEISDSPQEKAETQKLVDRLRKKYGS